jgi:glycosyltransferase involved in cell wall biosynthesis
LRDYLPPPDAGIVILVGDAAALRSSVEELLNNPEKAKNVGNIAREYAESRFNPGVHFRNIANLLREVISQRERRH